MKKEQFVAKLHDSMVERAASRIESGQDDFPAYPLLGKVAVSLVVGIGNKSDAFYDEVNRAIVEGAPSQVYAIRMDTGNGKTDGMNRVRANLSPISSRWGGEAVVRASSPRTQTE